MAVFALLVTFAAPVQAAPSATWDGVSIIYEQHQYTAIADAKAGDSHGIPAGSKIYAYTETSSPSRPTSKAHLIYFAPGFDPATADSANLVVYDFTPPATYANGTPMVVISLSPQSQTLSDSPTSCQVMGIGWIVCPVSTFLAKSMDWLFGVLANFLTVTPLQSNTDNALFRGWSVMRNVANIAFVIGFLVIIYSQLSNMGLSNYGLKKMLPRLVIAAILVNISYWICTVAVDVSNILGYSTQDIFMSLRENVMGSNANVDASDVDQTWEKVTGAVLSGTALVGGGAAAVIAAGSIAGAVALLLPTLVFVIIAALVAILIMAVRQALITILVILAPLAFIAFLLPNTEKYFERWKGIFTTMLVLFPVFAVIFGGSQVAGTAIIQNATSIVMLLLGMATQVAPLFVLPFLIKFSGGLIGQIAGMTNNKSKGLVDRTRNWSKERAEQQKASAMGKLAQRDANGLPRRRRDVFARTSRRLAMNKRNRDGKLKANQGWMDADWANSSKAHAIQSSMEQGNMVKERGEAIGQALVESQKVNNVRIQQLDLSARSAKVKVDEFKTQGEANWDEIRAGDARSIITPAGLAGAGLASFIANRDAQVASVHGSAVETDIQAARQRSAKEAYSQRFVREMDANTVMQQRAGGIANHGALKAQAHATAEMYGEQAKVVELIKKASPIAPGDVDSMVTEFVNAVRTQNVEAARAHIDMLANENNPGIVKLREVLASTESMMSPDTMISLKHHINASQVVNTGAEDIATWSRDTTNLRTVTEISQDVSTWSSMSAAQFAGMKKSSQLIATSVPGAISPKTARTIIADHTTFSRLKEEVQEEIERIAST
jgi:hypothetical protein